MELFRLLHFELKPFRDYIIRPGKVYSANAKRVHFNRSIRFRCQFTESCEYTLSPKAADPYNRLCGIETSSTSSVYVGWKWKPEQKRYQIGICFKNGKDITELLIPMGSWPRTGARFDVTFKPGKDFVFVYIASPNGKHTGGMEVANVGLDPSLAEQLILFPKFNAGLGAPQSVLIRLKYGKA